MDFKIINAAKIFLIVSLCAYLVFSFFHLASFLTADEHYWIYERIPQYWDAISSGDFKKTYINDKPGVSLALISGIGYFANSSEMGAGIEQNKNIKSLDPHHDDNLKSNLLALRLPLVIINSLFILSFFWLIKKLTENTWISLWSAMFIALSPILIGISQIINPDALLWSFTTAAILSYLNLLKSQELKFLILTSLFIGFSLLTKYVANILFPLFIFLLAFYFVAEFGKNIKINEAKKYIYRQFSNLGIIIIGSLLVVSVFMPAVFVKFDYLKKLTLDFSALQKSLWLILVAVIILLSDALLKNKLALFIQKYALKKEYILKVFIVLLLSIFAILLFGRNIFPQWDLFQNIPFDIKNLSDIADKDYPNIAGLLLLEFNPLVFSLTPLVLFLLAFLWIKTIFKKNDYPFLVFSLSLSILFYFLGSILSGTLATIRYSIMLYPLVGLLAGISLWEICKLFGNWKFKNEIFSIFIVVISFVSLFLIKPFYFNYTNSFLPKNQIITDSWGYGGYEAVQYLNALPEANKLTIWSDFFGVCEFFKGECLTKYDVDFSKMKIDYYVLTRRGKIRYKYSHDKADAKKYYSDDNPVWQLEIDGRPDNYVKVFKSYD